MHGIKNGAGMLNELCNNNDIIAVQVINHNFNFHAVSGMTEAIANGIIRGRPFRGVAFLWHNLLNKYIQVLKVDSSGRCIALKMQSNFVQYLLSVS